MSRRKALRFVTGLGAAFVLGVTAFIILMMRMGYPEHRVTALTIYLISWLPFIWSIRVKKEFLRRQKDKLKKKTRPYLLHGIVAVILLLLAYAGNVLVPVERTHLTELGEFELSRHLEDDRNTLHFLHQSATNSLNGLLAAVDRLQGKKSLLDEEEGEALDAWENFLQIAFELEIVTAKYKGFYQIDYLARKKHHTHAFLLAYFAYV
ncbi:MAG: hypothetical protein AAF492_28040, partial [Verrucomicrobiota bacterium]